MLLGYLCHRQPDYGCTQALDQRGVSGIDTADFVDDAGIFTFSVSRQLLNDLRRYLVSGFGADRPSRGTKDTAQSGMLSTQPGQNTRTRTCQQAGQYARFLSAA